MKSTRFNFGRALLTLCAIFFVSFSFISCQQETETEYVSDYVYEYVIPLAVDSESNLIGDWSSSSEKFSVGSTNFSNYYFDSTSKNWVETYTGDNLYYIAASATSGYIYFKYTKAATANWSYSSDVSQAPDVGKWYAIAYKDLTSSTISLSGAYKASGVTSTDTLEEAIKEFTVEKGYFSYYSELTKN